MLVLSLLHQGSQVIYTTRRLNHFEMNFKYLQSVQGIGIIKALFFFSLGSAWTQVVESRDIFVISVAFHDSFIVKHGNSRRKEEIQRSTPRAVNRKLRSKRRKRSRRKRRKRKRKRGKGKKE